MSDHSYYEFVCLCGEKIHSEVPATICPNCKRELIVDRAGEPGYQQSPKGKP